MTDEPERIWIDDERPYGGSVHVFTDLEPHVRKYAVEYLRTDHALALVAEAYALAGAVCNDAKPAYDGHRDPDRAERENVVSDALSDVADDIRAMTPSDALAAREARDKRVRDDALREAAQSIKSMTLLVPPDAIGAREAARVIRGQCARTLHALIEGDQTDG